MSPPKGWTKNKEPVTVAVLEPKQISIEMVPEKVEPAPLVASAPIKDDRFFPKVVLVWRDSKGREKTTTYVVANLVVHEEIDEKFTEGGKKQASIHITIDTDVLEKT